MKKTRTARDDRGASQLKTCSAGSSAERKDRRTDKTKRACPEDMPKGCQRIRVAAGRAAREEANQPADRRQATTDFGGLTEERGNPPRAKSSPTAAKQNSGRRVQTNQSTLGRIPVARARRSEVEAGQLLPPCSPHLPPLAPKRRLPWKKRKRNRTTDFPAGKSRAAIGRPKRAEDA